MPADPHQDILDTLGILPTDEETLAQPSPLYREMTQTAPGQVRSAASNLLGVTDAMRALRGQMTPEEQQLFALGALPGIIPGGKGGTLAAKAEGAAAKTMGEIFPTLFGEHSAANLTPQQYVSKLSGGNMAKFAADWPGTYNVLKKGGYLPEPTDPTGINTKFDALTQQYKNWTEKHDLPYVSMDEHDTSKLTPIQKMGLAGFKQKWDNLLSEQLTSNVPTGPSSKYDVSGSLDQLMSQQGPGNPLAIKTFPREMPFGVPPQAQQLGFTAPALHGTGGQGWEGAPDVLKLPDEQLGVHFGNPKQAAIFSTRTQPSQFAAPRTFPVVLQAQNPLEMRDMGSWYARDIDRALEEINAGKHVEYLDPDKPHGGRVLAPEAKGLFPASERENLETIQDYRDYIASKGYDSVKYINSVEDVGSPSHILFQGSPTNPNYVIGARSPFARFDPSQLHLPSLAAGLGGLTLYPFRGSEDRPE